MTGLKGGIEGPFLGIRPADRSFTVLRTRRERSAAECPVFNTQGRRKAETAGE